jgi:hypothetical protein
MSFGKGTPYDDCIAVYFQRASAPGSKSSMISPYSMKWAFDKIS